MISFTEPSSQRIYPLALLSMPVDAMFDDEAIRHDTSNLPLVLDLDPDRDEVEQRQSRVAAADPAQFTADAIDFQNGESNARIRRR